MVCLLLKSAENTNFQEKGLGKLLQELKGRLK
jgi:hypothetical protein